MTEVLIARDLESMNPGKEFDAIVFQELGKWTGRFYIPRAVSTCRDDALWLLGEVRHHCRFCYPGNTEQKLMDHVQYAQDTFPLAKAILGFILLDEEALVKTPEEKKRLEACERIRQEQLRVARELEDNFLPLLRHYIKCLKGEEQDLTGMGLWKFTKEASGRITKTQVINMRQWEAYKEVRPEEWEVIYKRLQDRLQEKQDAAQSQ